MSKVSIPVVKFLFRDDFKPLKEALHSKPSLEVEEHNAVNDLATYVTIVPAALIIISLRDKNDLIQIATFVKSTKKIAKDKVLKLVVINFSGDKTFERAINKLGIQELVETHINTKALLFKIDFWIKSLVGQVKFPLSQITKAPKSEVAVEQERMGDRYGILWKEPLDLEDDIWLVKGDNDCKKILSKWLVKILGPSPYVGQWVDNRSGGWGFEFKTVDKELYVSGEGSWIFQGDHKPEFVWKENLWLITGHSFELFYQEGDNVQTRLKSTGKHLSISHNSIFAKTKESMINESFNKELVVSKEADQLKYLEGKSSTDKLGDDPLSGKGSPADVLDGHLSGKSSTDFIHHENLSGVILPFQREKSIDEITSDASISSLLTYKGKEIQCGLEDRYDDHVVFKTDDMNIELRAPIKIDLVYQSYKTTAELSIEGSVQGIHDDGEGSQYVTIELEQKEIEELSDFMENYENRQRNINEFLRKVKGL
jgi:hypothetical protein